MRGSGVMRPFFIVGCGRSGTSLLRSILNSHRDIAIPLESLFIVDYLSVASRIDLSKLIRLLVLEPEIEEWGIKIGVNDFNSCRNIAMVIRKCHEEYARINGKKIWGQKTPRLVRNLELLSHNFPDARFIHLIRDPRSVAESLRRSNVHRSNPYFAAKRWDSDVRNGLAFAEKYPDKIICISYEELVLDIDLAKQKLFSFLDLPFNKEVLADNFDGSGEYSKFYKNIHNNLNQKVTSDFVSLWAKRLSLDDIRIVETICRETMTSLGYREVTGCDESSQFKLLQMKVNRLQGLFMQLWRYLYYRPRYLFYILWRKWRLGLLWQFVRSINF